MDVLLTDDLRALRDDVRGWLDAAYPPARVVEMERDDLFPDDFWAECAARGWTGIPVPVEHGGRGGGVVDLCVFVEEVARTSISLSTLYITATIFASHALDICGTDEQQARYLPAVADGSVRFALGMSEPGAGSDFAGMQTRAEKIPGGWRLDGLKGPVSGAERAGVLITAARTSTDEASRHRGITLFLVPADSPGLRFERRRFASMKALPVDDVVYEHVRVGDDAVLGDEGGGFRHLLALMDIERTAASAQMVGVAQAAVDDAVAYAKERQQYGRPIGTFQAVAHPLADAYTEIAASRALILSTALMRDRTGPCPKEASMAKLFATNMALRATNAALQTTGAVGYEADSHFVRRFLEARGGELGGGTSQIQRNVIARFLGLG